MNRPVETLSFEKLKIAKMKRKRTVTLLKFERIEQLSLD